MKPTPDGMSTPATPRITLKPGKARPIEAGHPWIFSGAMAQTTGQPAAGDVLEVLDPHGKRLGFGWYSPNSQIRVRMLDVPQDFDGRLDVDFFARAFARALQRRRMMGLGPQEGGVPGQTTGYRLVNSEGDGLPGVVVDVFGPVLAFQLTTLAAVTHRASIVAALGRTMAGQGEVAILEVPAPPAIARLEGIEAQSGWHTPSRPEQVWFEECGIAFHIDPAHFQKTGHFADMRLHRSWVASLARGRRVLDAYSYTGGFGLHAAKGGASHVVCVDSSQQAVDTVLVNARHNGFSQVEAVRAKVDDYLRSAYDRKTRFDIVVLDPPKLAPSRHDAPKALKVYEALTIQALRLVEPGGILCLGSCSEAIGVAELERVLWSSALRLGQRVYAIYTGTQSPDHPVPPAMPEGRYLSFVAATT